VTIKQASAVRADARGLRLLVLRSTFNAAVVDGLVAGAQEALRAMGARDEDVRVADVPGAFELPVAASVAARSGRWDAIVALGAVIRGDTDHYEHIAREAAAGLAAVARESGVPVGFGVLTVSQEAQALARAAAGPGNKGGEAARAAVATARVLESLRVRAAPSRAGRTRAVRRPGKIV
jgi:6,7-dimethyl-8-ribityllumazine synthase